MSRRAAIAVASALAAFAAAALPLGLRMAQQAAIAANAAKPTARSYVQDGLVAMWDGIENAGWGVHDNNATNWVDLVNGQSARVSSSMNWGKMLPIGDTVCFTDSAETNTATFYWAKTALRARHTFVGTNGKGELRAIVEPSPVLDCATATVETVTSAYTSSSDNVRHYSVIGFAHRYITDRLYDGPLWTGIMVGHYTFLDPSEPIISRSVSVCSTNLVSYYLSGRLTSSESKFTRIRHKQPHLISSGASRAERQAVYCARFYNRALTAEEIAHNAAIDRRRFGTAADAE